MLDDLQEFLAPYRTTLDALFRHCCLTGRGAGQFDAEAGHIESNPNPNPNPKPNPNPNSIPNPNPNPHPNPNPNPNPNAAEALSSMGPAQFRHLLRSCGLYEDEVGSMLGPSHP